jgi:hypothetical protein
VRIREVLDGTSSVSAAGFGKSVTMTVDSKATPIKSGNTYAGGLILSVA